MATLFYAVGISFLLRAIDIDEEAFLA